MCIVFIWAIFLTHLQTRWIEETNTQQPATTLPAKTLCCPQWPVILWWDRTFSGLPRRFDHSRLNIVILEIFPRAVTSRSGHIPEFFPKKVKSEMCTTWVLPLRKQKQSILSRWMLLYETMNLNHHVTLKAKQYRILQGNWHPWVMAKLLWNHPTLSLQVFCDHSL